MSSLLTLSCHCILNISPQNNIFWTLEVLILHSKQWLALYSQNWNGRMEKIRISTSTSRKLRKNSYGTISVNGTYIFCCLYNIFFHFRKKKKKELIKKMHINFFNFHFLRKNNTFKTHNQNTYNIRKHAYMFFLSWSEVRCESNSRVSVTLSEKHI